MKFAGRSAIAALASLAVLSSPFVASAQPTAEDKAAAEALFDEALALVEKGEIAPACERFAESQRRDPQLGTLLYLATCHEQQGKTATAWVEFKDALSQAEQASKADRVKQAKEGVARVEAMLSRIRLRVAAPAEGEVVTVNGREVRTFDVALPYDPGEITVEAKAPGRAPFTTTITLATGAGTTDVEVPALAEEKGTPIPPVEEPGRDRTLAYIVGGAGLGVMALGFAFGGIALAEKSSADDACEGRFCSQEGLDGHDQANAWAWASNVTIGVGAAAVATGVVLFFVGPELSPAEPGEPSADKPAAGAKAHRNAAVLPWAGFDDKGGIIGVGGTF